VSRQDQDALLCARSRRAGKAMARAFRPTRNPSPRGPRRQAGPVRVDTDDIPVLPRPDNHGPTAFRSCAQHFGSPGTVEAGNASVVNDGRRCDDRRFGRRCEATRPSTPARACSAWPSAGLPRRVSWARAGASTRKLMERLGAQDGDFDLIEPSTRPFASSGESPLMRANSTPRRADHVNPHGGAIALGQSARHVGREDSLYCGPWCEKNKGKLRSRRLCVGVGQGVSLALSECDGDR